jgi:selenocysteine lyase/cysteine desulfurase
VPTHALDLSAHPADFVALSFYKMFGYPTGLGALVVRTDVAPLLDKVGWMVQGQRSGPGRCVCAHVCVWGGGV